MTFEKKLFVCLSKVKVKIQKFEHITKMIGLDKLNLSFVYYKKIMKIQFLKYGKT